MSVSHPAISKSKSLNLFEIVGLDSGSEDFNDSASIAPEGSLPSTKKNLEANRLILLIYITYKLGSYSITSDKLKDTERKLPDLKRAEVIYKILRRGEVDKNVIVNTVNLNPFKDNEDRSINVVPPFIEEPKRPAAVLEILSQRPPSLIGTLGLYIPIPLGLRRTFTKISPAQRPSKGFLLPK
ncbi:hypothetical protein N7457_006529 [Penicillium paradoxum]|uniref:uncharacterized protein n=1 Tax=Penicillium paradoxum TaxID=176176 RepID=UPI0025465A27|nr:uncharacterized protein N7457_006529 [Penicillium paradoxum]KAJ5778809.1 hypothetical protein N7457_006529 [Penicillium paradoxum]